MSFSMEIFKSLREKVNWGLERDRRQFLKEVDVIINDWDGPAPDLRGIFRSEEIESLCHDFITKSWPSDPFYYQGERFIRFMIVSGYKDEPEEDEKNGVTWLYRTTPIHLAARHNCYFLVEYLFHIYYRLDVNYTDEDGLSHFHAACLTGRDRIVEKFLELGQDPNVVWRETGNTPLHLALEYYQPRVITLLLNRGVHPNFANRDGSTPLHLICKTQHFYKAARDPDLAELFFKINEEIHHQKVEVDAVDRQGNTPLHLAATFNNQHLIELLLMRGANPNSANAEGLTPLHFICKSGDASRVEMLFAFCFDIGKTVQIDARDNQGWTPLQWAVSRLAMNVANQLLDLGADMSGFVFPDESLFADHVEQWRDFDDFFKFKLGAGLLTCVEFLEQRGYRLDPSGAITIEKLFTKYGLFPERGDLETHWYDEEEFAIWVDGHDVLRLSPEESAQCLSFLNQL
ncbi:unnamed protein product [Trichogramma brassicae]|uniref:Uncharacterized protein n=1 Tax=Trichogramma brassicae TaxID=86971 RepID=A0A6H5IDG0_9HYME|nr:unnamed protein product [Trichogramma brassicae]